MSESPISQSGQVGAKIAEDASVYLATAEYRIKEDESIPEHAEELSEDNASEELSGPKAETSDHSKTPDEECTVEPIRDEVIENNPSGSSSKESGTRKKGKVAGDFRKTETGELAVTCDNFVDVLSTLLARLNESEVTKECLDQADDDTCPAGLKEKAIVLRGAITWLNTMNNFGLLKFKSEEHDPNCERKTTSEESGDSMKRGTEVSKSQDALSCLEEVIPALTAMLDESKQFKFYEKDDKTTKSSTTTIKKPDPVRPRSGSKVDRAIRSQPVVDQRRKKKEEELYESFDAIMASYETAVTEALGLR
ncbi:hypothetical protein NPIL_107111, partial [Nephila pilipes]